MPRLNLTGEQQYYWPPLAACTRHTYGSQRGYTCVAERGQWHPYAGRHGIGYIRVLGPLNGSTWYQSVEYATKPATDAASGLAVSRVCAHY